VVLRGRIAGLIEPRRSSLVSSRVETWFSGSGIGLLNKLQRLDRLPVVVGHHGHALGNFCDEPHARALRAASASRLATELPRTGP